MELATLGVAGVAAVGSACAAVITGRLSRAEGDRTRTFEEAEAARARQWSDLQAEQQRTDARHSWERDRVTDHYLTALRAAQQFLSAALTVGTRPYLTTPTGDVQAAWEAVDAAQGAMMHALVEASVVARAAVKPILVHLLDIDSTVLVPLARPTGVPPILLDRRRDEQRLLTERIMLLTLAMRVDLGLADDAERERVSALTAAFVDTDARSLAAVDDSGALRRALGAMNVTPLQGAAADYRIGGTALSEYQLPARGLRRSIAALLVRQGDALSVAVADDLLEHEDLAVLKEIVRYVESGLRDGPAQRDAPGGGRVVAWPRRGPAATSPSGSGTAAP